MPKRDERLQNTVCRHCHKHLYYNRPVVIIVQVEGYHQSAKDYTHTDAVYDALDAGQADVAAYHPKCFKLRF